MITINPVEITLSISHPHPITDEPEKRVNILKMVDLERTCDSRQIKKKNNNKNKRSRIPMNDIHSMFKLANTNHD